MVGQGAGAAGPVLLTCRQWDPHGLVRGSLVAELVRDAVHHYFLGACSGLFLSVQRSWQFRGERQVPVLASPPLPPPFLAPPGPALSCPCLLVRHSTRSVRSAS